MKRARAMHCHSQRLRHDFRLRRGKRVDADASTASIAPAA